MFNVLCVGLMVGDIIVSPVSKNIMEIDTCPINQIGYFTGGDALNTAVALSRLGKKVKAVGVVGNDVMGKLIIKNAGRENVDMSGVVIGGTPTATSIVLAEQTGERHFAFLHGANELLMEDMVSDQDIQASQMIYVGSAMALKSLDGDGLARLFERAKGMGKITAFDCTYDKDGLWLQKIKKALQFADIFIPSYEEAVAITGKVDTSEMARFFSNYGLRVFGVKLGAKGSYLTDFENEYRIGAFPADQVVDTTGAGDCYMAGFLAAYPESRDAGEAGVFASAAAKFCVEALGATSRIPSFETVKAYIAKHSCMYEKTPFRM